MKSILPFFIVACLTCAACAEHRREAEQRNRPNVLMIAIDDLNDWVGCLGGHPQAMTPSLDRFAEHATLFANAHCQAPVCNPSRVSLMTGLYPHTTGVYFLSPVLAKVPELNETTTLPEVFAEAGYETLGVGKLFHGSDQQYFQAYGGRFGGMGPRPKEKISHPGGHPLWDWGAYPETNAQMPDTSIADWAVAKLKEDFESPFFLGVGFMRPHVPMYAPQEWFDRHPLDQVILPKVLEGDRDDLSEFGRDLTTLEHITPTQDWMESHGQWRHAVQSYLASTTFVDHCVGRVLDALSSSPYAENTIVIVWSDHGFHLGEKRRWAKRSLWEDGTRVPLMIQSPDFRKGQVCQRPAELLDIFPTLLELAGMPAKAELEGQSLVPLLKNPSETWDNPALTTFGKGNHSVRSTRYRLIEYLDGTIEFYDHSADPNEWHNLALNPKYAERIQEHRRHLPMSEAEILDGKSTGHKAYAATLRKHSLAPNHDRR